MPRIARVNLDAFNVKVRSRRYGLIELRSLSLNDVKYLAALDTKITSHQYAVRVIHHQLISPDAELQWVDDLPLTTLKALVRAWLTSKNGLRRALPSGVDVIQALKDNLQTYLYEYQKDLAKEVGLTVANVSSSLSAVMSGMSRYPSLLSLTPSLTSMQSVIGNLVKPDFSSIVGNLTSVIDAYSAVSHFAVPTELIQSAIQSMAKSIDLGNSYIANQHFTDSLHALSRVLVAENNRWVHATSSQLSQIAKLSLKVDAIDLNLGGVYQATFITSQSYGNLLQETVASLDGDRAAPVKADTLLVSSQTTAGLVSTVAALGHDVSNEADAGSLEIIEHIEHEQRSYADDLEGQLAAIHPRLAVKYQAMWQSMESSNPERAIHSALSGRELLAQFLRMAAPDDSFTPEEIKQHGHNNKVTRKMRASRVLGSKSSSHIVELIDNTAKTIDVLYDCLAAKVHDESGEYERSIYEVKGFLLTLRGVLTLLVSAYVNVNSE